MKLWLDDNRRPPSPEWYWVKTCDEAIAFLAKHTSAVTHCSLDHDLCDEHMEDAISGYHDRHGVPRERYRERTGYSVLAWMVEHDAWVPDITVHTMNPVGRQDMVALLMRYCPQDIAWRVAMPPKTAEW